MRRRAGNIPGFCTYSYDHVTEGRFVHELRERRYS
jgi:hypothetical protein